MAISKLAKNILAETGYVGDKSKMLVTDLLCCFFNITNIQNPHNDARTFVNRKTIFISANEKKY